MNVSVMHTFITKHLNINTPKKRLNENITWVKLQSSFFKLYNFITI